MIRKSLHPVVNLFPQPQTTIQWHARSHVIIYKAFIHTSNGCGIAFQDLILTNGRVAQKAKERDPQKEKLRNYYKLSFGQNAYKAPIYLYSHRNASCQDVQQNNNNPKLSTPHGGDGGGGHTCPPSPPPG